MQKQKVFLVQTHRGDGSRLYRSFVEQHEKDIDERLVALSSAWEAIGISTCPIEDDVLVTTILCRSL